MHADTDDVALLVQRLFPCTARLFLAELTVHTVRDVNGYVGSIQFGWKV